MSQTIGKDGQSDESALPECICYDGPLLDQARRCFTKMADAWMYGPNKYLTLFSYQTWFSKMNSFEVRNSDVFVATYPKSGTTWMQEIAWCIMHDLDFDKAKTDNLLRRSPHLEFDTLLDDSVFDDGMEKLDSNDPSKRGVTWKLLHTIDDPRIIKTHFQVPQLPRDLLASKAKIIFVSRDPKDVCVSYYYYWKKIAGFIGSFDDFVDLFLADLLYASPYWKSVLGFWEIRHRPNVLFVRFEDLKKDTFNVLKKVSKYLGKDFDDDQIDSLVEHTSFENTKRNPAATIEDLKTPFDRDDMKFLRKGKVGDGKAHMSTDHIRRFQEWTSENLKDSDFPYYRS